MQNVLVTGATGFVGRSVCQRLSAEGVKVRAAVRSLTASSHLPAEVEAVVVGPIGADTDWLDALHGIDTVIHLAARVHVMNDRADDPLAAFRSVNVLGTERLAATAAAREVKRFVFVSSAKALGEEAGPIPLSERGAPAPADPYGQSKLEAEDLLFRLAASTGLEVVVLRPPLVYGPGVKANFRRLLALVDRGVPLPLGSVQNRRSMVYLGNLVDAIIASARHPQAAGNAYLVSDGVDVSTPELVERIAAALGRPARLFSVPCVLIRLAGRMLRKTDVVDRLLQSLTVDCSKIQQDLGWAPPFSMAEGLAATAQWYRSSKSRNR